MGVERAALTSFSVSSFFFFFFLFLAGGLRPHLHPHLIDQMAPASGGRLFLSSPFAS